MKRSRTLFLVTAVLAIGLALVWFLSGDGPTPAALERVEATALDAGTTVKRAPDVSAKNTVSVSGDAGMPEATTGGGKELARFGWGSGEGNLGKSEANESNPEAPMSLTVDALGNTWILDQVNGRLVKLDKNGKTVGNVPVPLQAAQDVVVTPDGKALVMDRLVDKSIAVLGADGKPAGELPIEGKGMSEGGASTGVFADGEDVYVEREHGDSVKIGSTSGTADPARPEVPGRPAQDGKTYLTANIVNGPGGLVAVTAVERSGSHRFTRQLPVGQPIVALNALDADRNGIIYLGTVVRMPQGELFEILLVCLDPVDGRPIGAAKWPANQGGEETFRELSVMPEGGVVFLARDANGARAVQYTCQ